MSVHVLPLNTGAPTRRRASQLQQQPARFWLNRQQQQQGSTEFQRCHSGACASGGMPSRATHHDRFDSCRGGQGGTPVDLPEAGALTDRAVRSCIHEASVNVDA